MASFDDPKINFGDQSNGRYVTVTLTRADIPAVTVKFIDPARPDETNAQERVRVLQLAKSLLNEAVSVL